ncbi:hypothetical protein B0T16DRAFT_17555 [Cercophora newfieldiana]|uniref:Uncharacterized protein n=1 Tax=Cercophora newfieldiana TaxID=92897 RepID=A0AA39YNI9_9PEZI|nr:hypothetical protein B0T16DRAFT_17555 [Cercophora newfieldiana]
MVCLAGTIAQVLSSGIWTRRAWHPAAPSVHLGLKHSTNLLDRLPCRFLKFQDRISLMGSFPAECHPFAHEGLRLWAGIRPSG